MINVYSNIRPQINTFSEPIKTARISTFGIVDFKTSEEKMFYDLEIPREKIYYYAINKQKLQTDGGLLKTITNQVKTRISDDENLKVSYGVYDTSYDDDYVFCIHHSTLVQDQKIEKSS